MEAKPIKTPIEVGFFFLIISNVYQSPAIIFIVSYRIKTKTPSTPTIKRRQEETEQGAEEKKEEEEDSASFPFVDRYRKAENL